jgi:GxxExxY protein
MRVLQYEELTYKIIGTAREVYHVLGPGYLESVYEDAFSYELKKQKINFERQVELDVHYKELIIPKRFRADMIIEGKILIENKAIKKLSGVDEAQLINYLKSTRLRVGLIFNFGARPIEFMRRIV